MSFSLDIKEEIIRRKFSEDKKLYLLRGFITFNSSLEIEDNVLWCHLNSISPTVIRKIYSWLKEKYDVKAGVLWASQQPGFNATTRYNFKFNETHYKVFSHLRIQEAGNLLEQKKVELDTAVDLVRAYAAGVFIATGSVSAPTTAKYFLGLYFKTRDQAEGFMLLMHKFSFAFKTIPHGKRFVCYLKRGALISDFLKFIDATTAVLEFENQWIYRDITNSIKRFNNIEIHNQMVVNITAGKQIEIITYLHKNNLLGNLPQRIQRIASLRVVNPEASFQELSVIYSKKYDTNISKSGVHHWFRRLKKCYNEQCIGETNEK